MNLKRRCVNSLFAIAISLTAVGVVSATPSLDAVLANQSAETKSRYSARHPAETLDFFHIKPGMTVVEALPGRGWYSKILVEYLGPDGHLIGADYAQDMFPKFGFFSEDFIAAKKTWTSTWPAQARAWHGDKGAMISAFAFGSMPSEPRASADAVLLIRALHNLARFEHDGAYLSKALDDVYQVLKPGGLVGVVQHLAREDADDDWASGSNGYLKKSFVRRKLEGAGFVFIAETAINVNPKDKPRTTDKVWRLPPSLNTSKDDPDLRAKYMAIGESSRMTMLFQKPRE